MSTTLIPPDVGIHQTLPENPEGLDFNGVLDRRATEQSSDRRRSLRGSRPIVLAPDLDRSDDGDALRPYQRLVVVGRWCALLVSAVALGTMATDRSLRNALIFTGFALLTALRTFRPIRHVGFELGLATSIVVELGLAITAIAATGNWNSPFVFLLIPPVVVGGFSQEGPLVLGYGLVSSLILTVLAWSRPVMLTESDWRATWQWTMQIVAFTAVASIGRRIVHDSLVRHSRALDDMNRLTSANTLLFALHKVAQSLPASLDLEDVLQSTIANARNLFPSEAITILIRDETTNTWEVVRSEGTRVRKVFEAIDLPMAVSAASRSVVPIRLRDLPLQHQVGFLPKCQSGVYVPLRSRDTSFGVLAIEHTQPGLDGDDFLDLLKRFAGPASVAIDNARWFGRIRRVAADEERVRIARDLHDRIGQSLAYLGFELDRLGHQPDAAPVADQVQRLRGDVSRVVAEIRETLYDIRTDVSTEGDVSSTIRAFLDRVEGRNPSLTVAFDHDVTGSLPARQEREMWLIAQEAIINVERHARATSLSVSWRSNGRSAQLHVADNGVGFGRTTGRTDSYGLRGLQERASAVGARIEILTSPDKGTTIICRLD